MLLIDTNIWLADGDRRSAHHPACAQLVADHLGELAAPVPVIAETAWLLLDRGGPTAQSAFLALVTTGSLHAVDLTAADWDRVLELVEAYADLALDVIDASLIAVAERLGQRTIATLNHRDFAVVRPAHCEALELVP